MSCASRIGGKNEVESMSAIFVSLHRRLACAAAAVIVLTCVSFSQAAFIEYYSSNMAALSDGGVVAYGDKIFSDFSVTTTADGGAVTPSASSIIATFGTDSVTGDYVLRFNLSFNAGPSQTVNATIRFSVAVSPDFPDWYIEDVGLQLSGVSAIGTGVVNIGEQVTSVAPPTTNPNNILGQLNGGYFNNGQLSLLVDHTYFPPVKQIWVTKDVSISGGTAGLAHLSEVYQTFSQIPEPASIALFAIGGMMLMHRRRKA